MRPQLRLCLAAKPALLPRAALHEAEAGQTCANSAGQAGCLKRPGNGHARPPVQPCAANAPSALAAVRPTAAPCGRGARPLLRPGSWGRMAAPYNNDTCSSTFPRWPRRYRPAPRLLDKVGRGLTQVSVYLPLPASGNTPGNPPSADRATRACSLRPAPRAPPRLAAASQLGVVPSPAA